MTPPIRIADDVEPAPSSLLTAGNDAGADAPDLAEDLSTVLSQLSRVIRREAPTPVGPGSFAALATLSHSGPMRLGDLAVREGVAPPTLTRMISNLEGAGYVVRRPDPGDRRAVRVSVTERGRQLVLATLAARAEVFRARLRGLPDESRKALEDAVPALAALAGTAG